MQVFLQCILKAQVINSANALILTAVRKDRDKDNETDNDNDKYIYRTPSKSDLWDFWPLRYVIRVLRKHDMTNKNNDKDNDDDKNI